MMFAKMQDQSRDQLKDIKKEYGRITAQEYKDIPASKPETTKRVSATIAHPMKTTVAKKVPKKAPKKTARK